MSYLLIDVLFCRELRRLMRAVKVLERMNAWWREHSPLTLTIFIRRSIILEEEYEITLSSTMLHP